jgi:hypothetical protein
MTDNVDDTFRRKRTERKVAKLVEAPVPRFTDTRTGIVDRKASVKSVVQQLSDEDRETLVLERVLADAITLFEQVHCRPPRERGRIRRLA